MTEEKAKSILELKEGYSEKELKQNYKRLSRKYHPDLNPDNPAAEAKQKDINSAYEFLQNKLRKSQNSGFNGQSRSQRYSNMSFGSSEKFDFGNGFGSPITLNSAPYVDKLRRMYFGDKIRDVSNPQEIEQSDYTASFKSLLLDIASEIFRFQLNAKSITVRQEMVEKAQSCNLQIQKILLKYIRNFCSNNALSFSYDSKSGAVKVSEYPLFSFSQYNLESYASPSNVFAIERRLQSERKMKVSADKTSERREQFRRKYLGDDDVDAQEYNFISAKHKIVCLIRDYHFPDRETAEDLSRYESKFLDVIYHYLETYCDLNGLSFDVIPSGKSDENEKKAASIVVEGTVITGFNLVELYRQLEDIKKLKASKNPIYKFRERFRK